MAAMMHKCQVQVLGEGRTEKEKERVMQKIYS